MKNRVYRICRIFLAYVIASFVLVAVSPYYGYIGVELCRSFINTGVQRLNTAIGSAGLRTHVYLLGLRK